ncbi:site-specific integrase [Rhodoblastus sp. 17X3]|uniref:tyrosine-type recombinase/integrase n=1 Tax=Rhodoblastus sp. 17X3 TaxID=3047026 RepID=UPI0024B6E2C5|nr:site-specific integrase [Rhodoblastus sp. 17X3]MDI9849976.1 site-specific integrase [Rhodoblastus sp. 17X3]
MARTVRDTNLETRAARLRLVPRRNPYWRVLEIGLHVGYRRTKTGGGTWVARRFIGEGRYAETRLGIADDLQDADGVTIFAFKQAQQGARDWWKIEERRELGLAPDTGPYTVANALRDYFEARERRGSKGTKADRHASDARIVPELGDTELAKLTTKRIRDWHSTLAAAAKLVRTKRTAATRATKVLDKSDAEAVRARRSTANRIMTILKAALNHAFHEGRAGSDEAWRKVKPFREVDTPVVHFLTGAECQRLINACDKDFRDLVRGALLTGCRYGELVRMQAGDFNSDAGTITVRRSKAGKPRHVVLNDEGQRLFAELTAGRAPVDFIFRRDDGEQWLPSQQQRPLAAASTHAKFEPPATFHILRHTYASTLAMKGVPMGVIAAQLGHSDTRMTEKHYAHLAPNYVADTIRAALPSLGTIEATNVMAIGRA